MSAITDLSDLKIRTFLCIVDLQSEQINFKASFPLFEKKGIWELDY